MDLLRRRIASRPTLCLITSYHRLSNLLLILAGSSLVQCKDWATTLCIWPNKHGCSNRVDTDTSKR